MIFFVCNQVYVFKVLGLINIYMAYNITVVPAVSTTSAGDVSIANNTILLNQFINNTVGGGTLIQILEMGPRLTLVWKT